ncbi:dihydrolipoyl dehydrogenase family protein [Galenea microaerophila]
MYDIIFIGGGLNYAGAVKAARKGKKVALIEKDLAHLGGVCLHNGCIPSKMYLAYAETVLASRASVLDGEVQLSLQKLLDEKKALIDRATQGVRHQCAQVDLIEGEAKLTAPHQVAVNGQVYEGEAIVMGTGASHEIPSGIDYNARDIITSDEVLTMETLPESIAIYGVGEIGLEMASFFAALQTDVTLINPGDKVLESAHPKIQKAIRSQLAQLGIELLENQRIQSAKSTKKGVHITFEDKSSLYTPILLVAVGRKANTAFIECPEIQVDEKGIVTDRFFETTLPKHYAIGDCNGKVQWAHAARAEVLNVVARILGEAPPPLDLDQVVKFIHTLPMSYAAIGNTKTEASSWEPLNQYPYSAYHQATAGMMISYADHQGFITGAEIFAPRAEELAAIVGMSLAGEMDANHAKKTIFGHPTFSEALQSSFAKLHK